MEPTTRRKGRPKSFAKPAGQTVIQSLDRALDVLDALAAGNGMTLTEIATGLGQSPATIYRVLSTLEARGIVEIDPQPQTWHIGPTAFRLGSAFLRRGSVMERSRPIMRELMEATGETSNLGIEKQNEVLFVSQIETHESIRAFFPPGTMSPMHASGIGKALLSRYSDDALDAYLRGRSLQRFTDKTIVSAQALKDDLVLTRNRGWAFDDEEKTIGMRCVAAPILNVYGETVAGVSVSGPTQRMPETQVRHIGELVWSAADRISRSLGAGQTGA